MFAMHWTLIWNPNQPIQPTFVLNLCKIPLSYRISYDTTHLPSSIFHLLYTSLRPHIPPHPTKTDTPNSWRLSKWDQFVAAKQSDGRGSTTSHSFSNYWFMWIPRDLDQIHADLRSSKQLAQRKAVKPAEDLPGLGEWYCVECAKWFEGEHSLVQHRRGKNHKRRSHPPPFDRYLTHISDHFWTDYKIECGRCVKNLIRRRKLKLP